MFLLIFVVFLLIGGLVTFVAVQNLTPVVHLSVLLWHPPDVSVGVWLIVAFLCGAVVLYLVSLLSALGDRWRMKALRKQVLALEERIAAMSQMSSSSSEQTAEDRLSSADTGPMIATPGVMNTPPPDSHIQSPLSPLQNFRQ
jgi:uncharacterized integral membrane protein